MKKLSVINLIAGPGTGKSTTAAGVFHELKCAGINAELVTEYAKDKVWEQHFKILENQVYILGKQFHRLYRMIDQVDIVVTDSPLILSLYYNNGKLGIGKLGDYFQGLVSELYNLFDNHNFYLVREKAFNPKGRMETEKKARQIDVELKNILTTHHLPFIELPGNRTAVQKIVQYTRSNCHI